MIKNLQKLEYFSTLIIVCGVVIFLWWRLLREDNYHNDLVDEIHSVQKGSEIDQTQCTLDDVRQCVDVIKDRAKKGNLGHRATCQLINRINCGNTGPELAVRLDNLIKELNKIPRIRAERDLQQTGGLFDGYLPDESQNSEGSVLYQTSTVIVTGW